MSDIARYLVTTADERTWKFDRPVIFLGEWCRRYDRRHVWSTMDGVVAEPYGVGQQTRDEDLAFVREFEIELNTAVGEALNRYHGTHHGSRFWRILLGHWLRRYVNVVFNRYRTLEQCLRRYNVSGTSVLVSDTYHLATQNSNAFIWACGDVVWDNMLCARILSYLGEAENIPLEQVGVSEGPGFRLAPGSAPRKTNFKTKFKERAFAAMDMVTNAAVRGDDAFVINTYLPRLEEMKVHLRLGQVPKIWRSPVPAFRGVPDPATRSELAKRFAGEEASGVRYCINALLFELLPMCYLEDFRELEAYSEQLPWPKQPRFVFTSNNSDTDEVFKYWAGTRAEDGVPYYTGQHGSNYGTHRYLHPSVEESVSDRFLTWGWTDGRPEHVPAFIFTTAGRRTQALDPEGRLLLVSRPLDHRINRWDVYVDFETYFADQQAFVSMLAPTCREKLIIRFHSAYRRLQWREDQRWMDFDPTLTLDIGDAPIARTIAKSRLIVYSYDSSGLLEGLARNIPTLAFWQNGLDHLVDHAKPWYQLLVDVGIVHLTPSSLASKVNAVWDDVQGWWQSPPVQTARRQFCERYAVTPEHVARDFVRLVTEPLPAEAGRS